MSDQTFEEYLDEFDEIERALIQSYVSAAVQEEQEACAKIAENGLGLTATRIASKIRARSAVPTRGETP